MFRERYFYNDWMCLFNFIFLRQLTSYAWCTFAASHVFIPSLFQFIKNHFNSNKQMTTKTMEFSNTICNQCYRCPGCQPCCSGGRVVCKNCSCPPNFHAMSSSQLSSNVNIMNNNNIAPNPCMFSSPQNTFLSNYNPMSPPFNFVNNNVAHLPCPQTQQTF